MTAREAVLPAQQGVATQAMPHRIVEEREQRWQAKQLCAQRVAMMLRFRGVPRGGTDLSGMHPPRAPGASRNAAPICANVFAGQDISMFCRAKRLFQGCGVT